MEGDVIRVKPPRQPEVTIHDCKPGQTFIPIPKLWSDKFAAEFYGHGVALPKALVKYK